MKKKLSKIFILFCVSIFAKPVLHIYKLTLQLKVINAKYLDVLRQDHKNLSFALWHENMIVSLLVHEGQYIHVLVSQHFDGEVISRILKAFGFPSIRGSSTRGGSEAYEKIKIKIKTGKFEIAFTPDGPTGPRRKAKLGIVRLSSETGIPIIPLAVVSSHYRRLNSWDQLLIVLPFSKCVLYYGKPIYIPPDLDLKQLQEHADQLSFLINSLDHEAEKYLNI
jgi:lysophospholipid acyltransferase (LPLAT)-like uncharacterized protein